MQRSDADGESALALLRMAGIDTNQVKYVPPGEFLEGHINIDTGDRHGIVSSLEDKTAYLDHHGGESLGDTSATEITYKALTSLGLLEKTPALDKAVKLVTQEDNRSFPDEEKYFKDHWHDTLLGLLRYMKFEDVVKYFESGKKPTDILSEDELEKMGLSKASRKVKSSVEQSWKAMEKLKRKGLIIDTKEYGQIAVDIDKKVPMGYLTAKAMGMGGYINWSPKGKSFFISTKKPLKESFSQGKKIRETMWIKSPLSKERLSINLKEILDKLSHGRLNPQGQLKTYLERAV